MISDILADALAAEREYKRTSVLDYSKYEYMLRSWENLTEQILAELNKPPVEAKTYTIFQGYPILNGEKIYDPCGEEPYTFISSDPKSKSVCVKNLKGDLFTFPALRFDITFETKEL